MTGTNMQAPTGPSSPGSGQSARRRLWITGTACLVAGVLIGVAAGAGEDVPDPVTQTDTVTRVTSVPVVEVRTVTKVRRVVRTRTVTEQVAAPEAAEPAAAEPADGGASDPAADYSGMNCSEIGHSFTVAPGSDPQHDADNDGVACESY